MWMDGVLWLGCGEPLSSICQRRIRQEIRLSETSNRPCATQRHCDSSPPPQATLCLPANSSHHSFYPRILILLLLLQSCSTAHAGATGELIEEEGRTTVTTPRAKYKAGRDRYQEQAQERQPQRDKHHHDPLYTI